MQTTGIYKILKIISDILKYILIKCCVSRNIKKTQCWINEQKGYKRTNVIFYS
jgi:hypothetical protein